MVDMDDLKKRVEKFDFDTLGKEARKNADKYNAELIARAKPESELMRKLEFIVETAIVLVYSNTITPRSEIPIGGRVSSYDAGQSYQLELTVKKQKDCPINTITFSGMAHIESGDTICAYFFKGKEETEKSGDIFDGPRIPGSSIPPSHFVEREYAPSEQALKIEKLRKNKVVVTYVDKSIEI